MGDHSESKAKALIDRGTSVPSRAGGRLAPEPRNVGDSPWLWLLLFAAFGMFGLFAISTKYQARQQAIEREFFGIRHMQQAEAEQVLGNAPNDAPLVDDAQTSLLITLRPLFLLLGIVATTGWIALLWRSSLGGASSNGPPSAEGSA